MFFYVLYKVRDSSRGVRYYIRARSQTCISPGVRIISGKMRFRYEDHVEELEAGDFLMYDSGRGHGMIAIGGEPCVFLAVVLKPQVDSII